MTEEASLPETAAPAEQPAAPVENPPAAPETITQPTPVDPDAPKKCAPLFPTRPL